RCRSAPGSPVLSSCRHHLDLDEEATGKRTGLDRGSRRWLVGEVGAVDLIDGWEAPDVSQEDRGLDDVVVTETEIAEDRSDVRHHLAGLGLDVVGGALTRRRIDGHLAGDEHEPVGLSGDRVGSDRLRCGRGGGDALGHTRRVLQAESDPHRVWLAPLAPPRPFGPLPHRWGRNPEEAARLSTKEYGTNQFLRHKPKGEILKRRRDSVPNTQYQVPLVRPRAESGERVAAAAGVGLVRVLDGEP